MTLLVKIVSPYMHSSMLYKLKSLLNTQKIRTKIEVLDVKNNITTTYSSMSEAAKNLKISQSGISQYFSRNKVKPYKSRYVFKKI
jgi:NUMOD1 domain-containing protein